MVPLIEPDPIVHSCCVMTVADAAGVARHVSSAAPVVELVNACQSADVNA